MADASSPPETPTDDGGRGVDVTAMSDRALVLAARCADGVESGGARAELVARYRPLVLARAARLHRERGPSHDDVVSCGQVGLLKAIRDFDVDRGTPFPAYAAAKVVGEMMRWFRDDRYLVHVPRPLHEQAMAVSASRRRLEAAGEPDADDARVARRTGLDVDAVDEARRVRGAERGRAATVDDSSLVAPTAATEDREAVLALRSALRLLDDGDRRLLVERYWRDLPQRAVGERLGVSQAQVSRLERRALKRLRSLVGEVG